MGRFSSSRSGRQKVAKKNNRKTKVHSNLRTERVLRSSSGGELLYERDKREQDGGSFSFLCTLVPLAIFGKLRIHIFCTSGRL